MRRAPYLVTNDKTAALPPRLHPADVDPHDARARRSVVRPGDQRLDRAVLTLDLGLDRAVGAVAHPARHPEPLRLALHRAPVPHPLHPANDQQPRALRHQSLSSRRSFASSMTVTPSLSAFFSFQPGSAPATT